MSAKPQNGESDSETPHISVVGAKPRRAPGFRSVPLRTLVPNAVTILGLCAGLTSIRFALEGNYEASVVAIIVASLFDAVDGRLARLLNVTSKFGAELDSLSDFVNFGVAPILLLYIWSLGALGGIGWVVALGYAIACALRLARFNTDLDLGDKPAWTANFFVGVPAPAAAGLVMLPFYVSFLDLPGVSGSPYIMLVYVGVVAALMVSRVPTFSGKRWGLRVKPQFTLLLLMGVGFLAAMLINYPWATLTGMCLAYFAMMPVSLMRWRHHLGRRLRRKSRG